QHGRGRGIRDRFPREQRHSAFSWFGVSASALGVALCRMVSPPSASHYSRQDCVSRVRCPSREGGAGAVTACPCPPALAFARASRRVALDQTEIGRGAPPRGSPRGQVEPVSAHQCKRGCKPSALASYLLVREVR